MDELTAIGRARKLLKDAGITKAPVDVEALASTLGFKVSRKELEEGEAGITFKKRDQKHICVNEKDPLKRQRFTIVHEIAHHVLNLPSVHGEIVPADELERFKGRPPEETLCDLFAAECLVPWNLIQPIAEELEFNLTNLAKVSDQFQASRACVASRLVQASEDYLAFVVAEDGVIQYSVSSKALREAKIWIQKGIELPRNSAAAIAIRNDDGEIADAELDGTDWSSSDAALNFSCFEEAIYYAPWKQTQSILVFEGFSTRPAVTAYEASRDDGLLQELDGKLPWPKR